jgi:hypothetical protein
MEKRLSAKIDMNRLIVESLGQLANSSEQIVLPKVPADAVPRIDPAELSSPKGLLERVMSRFGRNQRT